MWRRLLPIVASVGALIAMTSAPVAAATSEGLISISPPVKQFTIASGLVQANIVITLNNSSASDVGVSIKLQNFTPLSNGSIVLGSHGLFGEQAGLANWMSLPDGPNLTLKAKQKIDVHVLVDNRADLTPGGHYGAVVFSTTQLDTTGTNKVALNQQLTSLLFAKKVGGDVSKLELVSLKPSSTKGIPAEATIQFKSTGNVYVVPRGYVEVTDAGGRLLAKGLINPESTLIPQTLTRSFDTILQPVDGVKNPKTPYKLTAYYRIDGETQLRTETVFLGKAGVSKTTIAGLALAAAAAVLLAAFLWLRRAKKRVYRR